MPRELRLEAVGRRYGVRGPWVFRDVHLNPAPATLTRIEGPNGTGKSTLLRLLARIDAPTEGKVTGAPRTAYVPERFPAALPFTALGYLTHLGVVHGLSRTAAERAAGDWLDRFGATAHAHTPMSRLSKGSSQKVAVAQALLAEPELLILDEAWTGLDDDARAELERAVAERTAAGSAVVFVDHDPRRLMRPGGRRVHGPRRHPPPPYRGGTDHRPRRPAHDHRGARSDRPAPTGSAPPGHRHRGDGRPHPPAHRPRLPLRRPAPRPADRPPAVARGERPSRREPPPMTALLRYQTALLLRSQRWLPPFLLYAVFLGVGVQGGQPLLDSLGYTAAFLLPVAAWLVRICVSNEPPAARTVVAAAVGPGRAHLACVLVALTTAIVLGTTATVMVTLISDPVGSDHDKRVPVLEAHAAPDCSPS